MTRTLLHNIAQLVAVPKGPVRGVAFCDPPTIADAALVIEDERIAWFGPASNAPAGPYEARLDARGGTVVPGLCDCHTHVVFAGSRENEYLQRLGGATYLEIMQRGGGIRSSMRALRAASEDELIAQSLPRLRRMLAWGTTTVEAKTGYGLDPDHELKTLRAIARMNSRGAGRGPGCEPATDSVPGSEAPIPEIVPTYLGAHAVPPEFEGRADDYLDHMTSESLLGRIRDEGLAELADVFCERGAFSVDQARRFLTRCRAFGLRPKVHAEQITNLGGTRLAIELGAVSADHLEQIDESTIAALGEAQNSSVTIPVLLPGCSFFLGTQPAPARRLIAAGLPVAIATDCNPGSCMIESLPLVMSIAASLMKMTPKEALVAATANAAAALGRAGTHGAIAEGHFADLLVLDVPNLERWLYRVGVNAVGKVIKRGRVVLDNG